MHAVQKYLLRVIFGGGHRHDIAPCLLNDRRSRCQINFEDANLGSHQRDVIALLCYRNFLDGAQLR
jgi:hypothetical protein